MADSVNGVFKSAGKGRGVLRDAAYSFRRQPNDIIVPAGLVRKYGLVEGATVKGIIKRERSGSVLSFVESICGCEPDNFKERTQFKALIAIDPCDRFDLASSGDTSMRIIDLVAPIGKGTRGLIVSPPKAGKTMLLEKLANAIHISDPETRIIALLIDERPEEVTYFRRAVKAEVLHSSSDQSVQEHMELAEITLGHIRTYLECGFDVVVLVDSLTRMGRAFNFQGRGTGRTLSGGLGADTLEFPRRFFGLARNIEGGGSVTIIATALVETGSRMDQVIFQEFKGTGNSEIILERSLAEAYIFPAVNINASGTRKEAQLFDAEEYRRITILRRALADLKPKESMEAVLKMMEKYPTNRELLMSIPEMELKS
jgi:transcription termination factor Rho